jgi:hypothetical protein
MKIKKETIAPKRHNVITQKDISIAGISIFVLAVIMTLYFLYG